MEELQRKSVEEVVSCVSRLALFVCDELEPLSEAVLEADLEELYDFLVAVERVAVKWKAARTR